MTPDKPKVLLKEQPEYKASQIAPKAAEIIEALGLDVKQKTVLLKPSFVYPSRGEQVKGIITNPALVVGVIRALKGLGARKVLVAESSIMGPSRVSFETVGILPMIRGIAEPVYLDEMDEVDVDIENPFVQGTFTVPKIWLDVDVFVSMPKIKTNMFSGITLTVKNNLGMIRQFERLKYHDHRLHKKLADLYKVRPPDMVVADCIAAGEGQGPLLATPVDLGLMVGGNNAVAVDVVACKLAGFDPMAVEHIRLLIESGLGPASIGEIKIDGAELLSRARKFAKPDTSVEDISPNIKVFRGKGEECTAGCFGMLRGIMDPYVDQNGPGAIRPMNVIIGKDIGSLPADLDPKITLVLGDCAQSHKSKGQFIPGCCPRPLDIALVLHRIQGPVTSVEVSFSEIIAAMRGYRNHYLWRAGKIIAGKRPKPIENHVPLHRMLYEGALEIVNRIKG